MRNLYEEITNTIISMVGHAGNWRPCWVGAAGLPENGVSKRRYNGINVLLLWATAQIKGYTQARWATYRQWVEADCQVRKGEKATWITYSNTITRNPGAEDEYSFRFLKGFPVFNADQVDGDTAAPPVIVPLGPGQRFDNAEALIHSTKITIINEGSQPRYSPKLDTIWRPLFERFTSPEGYYATLFHEIGHATGHESRLKRDLAPRFRLESYAMEELVAELTSAFVCAHLGIQSSMREDHAAYIKNWLTVMKDDKAAIVAAASAASKAADWIIAQAAANENAPVERRQAA